MCGAGLTVWCWGGCVGVEVRRSGAEQGAWVALTGGCGCLRWVERLGTGAGDCLNASVFLEIGSDGYFDYTG